MNSGNRGESADTAAQPKTGMKAVAERAGVALSSVSRVLSDHPDVSAVMRNRVLDAAASLGYEPDLLARSLRSGATLSIGFVVGDISNPLLAHVALGAEQQLHAAGYSMLLANSGNDPAQDAAHIRSFWQRRVDGLLLSLADEGASETAAALSRGKAPYVLIDREVPLEDASAVLPDHTAGTTAAVKHLIDLGHRRIALVNGNPRVRPARQRETALRKACRAAPGVSGIVRSGAFSAEHGAAATAALLDADQPPTAIIAGSNQLLVGCLRTLREAGVEVPRDLSLVTCDDVQLSEFLTPPIATISRDPAEMGRAAADLLLARIGGQPPQKVRLPVGYRPTGSCAVPPRVG